jgi:cytochrome c oxidase assembly protein subunit 15
VAALSFHPLVEFANRVFTTVVVVAVVAAVLGAWIRSPRRMDLFWLASGLVAGVVAQIVLGGLTVLYHLAPPLVMAHFMLSLLVLADAVVLHHRAGQSAERPVALVGRDLIWLGRLTVAVTAAVIAVGTAVTGSGPHSGSIGTPRLHISFHSVAEVHASLVMLLIGLVLATIFALRQVQAPPWVQRRAAWMLGIMVAQAAIGYTQYFTRVPALLVGFHVAGATALWIAVLAYYLGLFARPAAPAEPLATLVDRSVLTP